MSETPKCPRCLETTRGKVWRQGDQVDCMDAWHDAPPAVAQAEPTRYVVRHEKVDGAMTFFVRREDAPAHGVSLATCPFYESAEKICAALNAVTASPTNDAMQEWSVVRPFLLTGEWAGMRSDERKAMQRFVDEMDDAELALLGRTPAPRDAQPDAMQDTGESDLPFPEASGPDLDAEGDPAILDLETFCAFCGLAHHREGRQRDCPCSRHIDGGCDGIKNSPCNAAPPDQPDSEKAP